MASGLAEDFTSALALHPRKAEYDACLAQGRECPSLIADVINYAIFNAKGVQRILNDELGIGALLEARGAPAVVQALANIAASSQDPLERIAALMMMRYYPPLTDPGEGTQLPHAAYADMVHRPLPETRLLAERHRFRPVPQAIVGEFARLAEVDDMRARRAAIVALGHPDTAADLRDIVLGLPETTEHWHDVAMASSKCGLPCAESLEHLARGPRAARLAAYEAVTFAPADERRKLVDMILKHVPEQIDDEERSAKTELIGSALSDAT